MPRWKETKALWLFFVRFSGETSMSRGGEQMRRRSPQLKATSVVVIGVIVFVIILCVYLGMMLMFPW